MRVRIFHGLGLAFDEGAIEYSIEERRIVAQELFVYDEGLFAVVRADSNGDSCVRVPALVSQCHLLMPAEEIHTKSLVVASWPARPG
jgi:hypothetical protein